MGETITNFILNLAQELTGTGKTGAHTPGWISFYLVISLIVLSLWYWAYTQRFIRTVRSFWEIFHFESEKKFTFDRLFEIEKKLKKIGKHSQHHRRLEKAWRKFSETAIQPADDSTKDVLRNTLRPAVFFNRDELGLEAGIWRNVPALFVSVGLLLTFLGLVAALNETGTALEKDANQTVSALKDLLKIASAKFIMSLTGLACSIVFTIVLRTRTKKMDKVLHGLCVNIEHGCDFMSEQFILRQMFNQAEEQTAHLKAFSTELVAQIAVPIKEDLPKAISAPIENAIKLLTDEISRSTNKGVEALVEGASEQLIKGVTDSLSEIKDSMVTVGDNLKKSVNRLDESSRNMTNRVDALLESLADHVDSMVTNASEQLTNGVADSLSEIKDSMVAVGDNLKKSVNRLDESSQSMTNRVDVLLESLTEHVHSTVKGASEQLNKGVSDSTREIKESMIAISKNLHESVDRLDKSSVSMTARVDMLLRSLVEQIENFSSSIDESTVHIGKYSKSIEQNASTVNRSSEQLRLSSDSLSASIEQIQKCTSDIRKSSETMNNTSTKTKQILDGMYKVFQESNKEVQSGLNALNKSVADFKNVIENYREIDDNLENAFNTIENGLQASISELEAFEKQLNAHFAESLTLLESVISQAEQFIPKKTDKIKDE